MGLTLRRALGAVLLAACLLPLHRLLDPGTTGLAGSVTRRVAEASWAAGLWGSVLLLALSAGLAVLVRRNPVDVARPAVHRLATVGTAPFAAVCGALALAAGVAAALWIHRGSPTSVDAMVQLGHARALLAGRGSLPAPGDPAAWAVQNAWLTEGGWASVYPPGHTVALALGLAAGRVWLVGPVQMVLLAVFSLLALQRLLPRRPVAARVAGLLVAVSPFTVVLGATHLSHSTAGALAALLLWAALRARDGGAAWAVLAGASVGAFVCTRPWTGLVLSAALLSSVWIPAGCARAGGGRWLLRRGVALGAGGLPFATVLLWWNRTLFGHPLRVGYTAAFGPAHGLGWHADPWGNAYGFREALAYTGADLAQLGVLLLESPMSALVLPGLALLLVRRLPAGTGVLTAWAVAGVAANAAYWHHGVHFGPRLLFETAPAWVALWVVAVDALTSEEGRLPALARRAVAWAAVLSVVAGVALTPSRAGAYRSQEDTIAPAVLADGATRPTLIFAHGSWASRVSARLTAAGMRRDSVETALRRNPLCAVDRYARWRRQGSGDAPLLDLQPRPGSPPGLDAVELSPGNRVLVRTGDAPDDACVREAVADRLGTLELEPLQWMAPPLPGSARVVARDLGPSANAAVQVAFPGYRYLVAVDGGSGRPPRLLGYAEGMQLLWGGASGLSEDGG